MTIRNNFLLFLLILIAGFSSCGGGGDDTTAASVEPTGTAQASRSPSLEMDSKPENENDPLVAEWKGGTLYLAQIDHFVEPLNEKASPNVKSASIPAYIHSERDRIIKTLAANYILLLEARERGISLTDAEIDQLIRGAKSRFESEEQYHDYLKKANQTEQDLVNVLYNVELGKKCIEDEEAKIRSSINDESMKGYYQENIDKFTPPHRTYLNRVEIHAETKRSKEEARQLAEKLYNEVKEKVAVLESLDEKRDVIRDYARQYSDGWDGQYNGGYINLYHIGETEKQYGKAFLDAAKAVAVGELSPLVETRLGFGFFIVKEQYPTDTHPFEAEVIQQMLPNMMMQEEMEKWREELKAKFDLKIYEDELWKNMEKFLTGTGSDKVGAEAERPGVFSSEGEIPAQ